MTSEIFPLKLVQAVSDWQRGGIHNQKVKRGQRLKAVDAELPEAFRVCTDPSFRQEAHAKDRVWQLLANNHLPETIAAWTADLRTAKTFKGGMPPPVVESRSVSRIAPKRDLVVARLFAPDLKAWGLSRGEIIETPKSTYGQTALWAQAIHRARSDLDGLIWTSRQCDPEQCMVLFEDRIGEADFDIHGCIDVSADASLLLELRNFGQRAGITIVL
jgi:hypothetical protein